MPKLSKASKPLWKRILKFGKEHPWLTIGGVVIPVSAFKAITGVADKIYSTHDILSQRDQKKIMEEQLKTLKTIAEKKTDDTSDKKNYIYNKSKRLVKKQRGFY